MGSGKKSFGEMIAALRKEQGITQLQLAGRMGVTDKAVSKWERNLSMPDVASIPRLAEVLGVTTDELLQVKAAANDDGLPGKVAGAIDLALRAVGLAMGVAVTVLTMLGAVDMSTAVTMLGIGLACLGIAQLEG